MQEASKKNFNQIISDFLISNRKLLLIVLAVVVCGIATIGILSAVKTKKMEAVFTAVVDLDNKYDDLSESQEDKDAFTTYAESIINDFKGTKAELLAYSRLGSFYFEEGDFEKALANYTAAYTNFPDDIAVSVYMFNAAMTQEELGDIDKAIALLEDLITKFKRKNIDEADLCADVPEAIFNIGRLYESKGDLGKAKEMYETLVAEYQSYNLSNIAKTRMLSIK